MSLFSKRYRGIYTPSGARLVFSYIILGIWSLVVLFPLYWLLITAFKTPIDVNSGPV